LQRFFPTNFYSHRPLSLNHHLRWILIPAARFSAIKSKIRIKIKILPGYNGGEMKIRSILLAFAWMAFACAASTNEVPPADLKMLSRAAWGASAPVATMKSHTPRRITIHHTATLQKADRSLKDKMQSLQKFSQNEGKLGNGKPKPAWPDVPYHFYIDCNGGIAEGRDVNAVGDTNTEYDPTGHVLVVLEGNFEEEQVTEAQWATLVKTVSWLAARYRVASADIQGHKDYAQTLCPGKKLEAKLADLRATLPAKK
jgi:hypothetical protein